MILLPLCQKIFPLFPDELWHFSLFILVEFDLSKDLVLLPCGFIAEHDSSVIVVRVFFVDLYLQVVGVFFYSALKLLFLFVGELCVQESVFLAYLYLSSAMGIDLLDIDDSCNGAGTASLGRASRFGRDPVREGIELLAEHLSIITIKFIRLL